MKKAAELATLCGVKVSLLFTDLVDGVHYLTNEPNIRVEYEHCLNKKKDGAYMFTYNLDDYPFKSLSENSKGEFGNIGTVRQDDSGSESLTKRLPDISLSNVFSKVQPSSVYQGQGSRGLSNASKYDSYLENNSQNLVVSIPVKKDTDHPSLTNSMVLNQSFENAEKLSKAVSQGLEPEQAQTVEAFNTGIEKTLAETLRITNTDLRRDEDVVVLLLLNELVSRYFAKPSEANPPDSLQRLMKDKISVPEMISLLSSIRFKDKNSDMILIILKQIDDNLLQLVLNPSSFNSQVNLTQGGRSLINIFLFLIKNTFQQIKIMKSIYCDDSLEVMSRFMFGHSSIKYVKVLVSAVVDLCCHENIETSTHPRSRSSQAGFQLHNSQHRQESTEKGLQGGIQAGTNLLEFPFQSSLLQPSLLQENMSNPNLNESTSFLDRLQSNYKKKSFEMVGSLRSDNNNDASGGAQDMQNLLISSGSNMNNFVSSLLKGSQPKS